jgi:hypothetical protein
MAPYMVETAFRYSRAAKSLWGIESGVALINAAISIEILLKSYNSKVVDNEGEVNQKYRFNPECLKEKHRKHDLYNLFAALPSEIKMKFEDQYTIDIINKYRDTFVTERYVYEPNTKGGGSTALIELSEKFVQKTVAIYKELGCEDSWVVNYPNV